MATARVSGSQRQKVPVDLPLDQFVTWAWKQNIESGRHEPRQPYRSPMFTFVRACAAHPDLKGIPGEKALEILQKIPVLSPVGNRQLLWHEMFPDSDDPEIEFVTTWDKIRVPAGEDILVFADGLAREKPLKIANPLSDKYSRFVSVAFHLQILRPGNHINLPVARLAQILGVNERTVSFYTQQARKDGYLTLLAKHHHPSGTAAKYKFAYERFDAETGEELGTRVDRHFRKEFKDSEEFKDSGVFKDSEEFKDNEEAHDQRENVMTAREDEGMKGLSGAKSDFERVSGKAGVKNSLKSELSTDRRKLLKMQAAHLEKRFPQPGGCNEDETKGACNGLVRTRDQTK